MKRAFLYSSLIIVLMAASGCGQNILKGMEDKETDDAQQYAALKSLDSGDFQAVLSACDKGAADPLDCSAAALGAAGLDPLDVARQLNGLIDSATTGDISAIGSLSGLDPSYLDEIYKANVQLAEKCEAGSEAACSQLVITSVAEVVIALAQVGENDVDVTDGISAADADTIAGLIASSPTVLVDTDGDGTLDPTPILDVIERDALYIINNINDSPFGDTDGDGTADTELGQVIEDQIEAIGGADCTAGSATCQVTAAELESYLQNQYGTSGP
ncbi:MAG: hypothetical protein IT393_02410 [Nitrospirae bacterium]|nr:hypothetical protein [Nitrospirota bacterium]